jgi:hypothetical protein
MKEPEIVIEETSPHGNLEAILKQDDRVAYLYLRALDREDLGIRSCWIRNLASAPESVDIDGMHSGIAPMMPAENCARPEGQDPLDASGLSLEWFPEGDGVAVIDDGEVLAVVPPWSFDGNFPGYARDAIGEGRFAWEMPTSPHLPERVAAARRFWLAWEDGNPWDACQSAFLNEYERAIGKHDRYFAIDGGNWPPRALIRANTEKGTFLLSLGISLRPQPQVELFCENPADLRRFELVACLAPGVAEESIMAFADFLSRTASLPWRQLTFLGHGHTIGCDAFAKDPLLAQFVAVLLVEQPPEAPDINPPRMDGEKVTLLWAVPITAHEREIARQERSKELIRRFPESWPLHLIGGRPVIG